MRPLALTSGLIPAGATVVASGKGGIGTSTVAGLLSLAASRSGASVLLVDGDVQFGVQHLLFAVPGNQGLAALNGGSVDPMGLPIPVTDGLMVVCGGPAGERPVPIGAELKATFRRLSPLLRAFGTSVIDAGSRYSTVRAALGSGASRLIVVCGPDRVSIAATYALVKHAWRSHDALPIEVVINGATATQAQVAFQALANACDRFLGGRRLLFAGAIPEDPTLRSRLADGVGLHHGDAGPATEAASFVQRRIADHSTAVATPNLGRN